MRGKLTLKGIRLYGFHGVLPAEKERGQFFEIDVEIDLSWGKGIYLDNLEETVDYARVFETVKNTFKARRYKLLEALALALADRILNDFPVDRAVVKVRKPDVPLKGKLDYAEVRVEREKKWYT